MSIHPRFRLGRALSAIVALLVMAAVSSRASALDGISDLSPEIQAQLRSSFDRFLHLTPAPGRAASDLAWDCLGVTALMRAGAPDAAARLRILVDTLLTKAMHRDRTTLVWGPNFSQEARCGTGEFVSFGHCNPSGTAFSFQSGLAIACLSEATNLLHDPSLAERARAALHYWDAHSTKIADCSRCMYYWYDDDPLDANRYVRNINVIMGYAAASLAARHGDTAARSVAEAVVNADIWERQHSNRGYLGRLDRQAAARPAEANRIEYHAAAVALFSAEIGTLLGLPAAIKHGEAVWRDWATCDTAACRTDDCRAVAANAQRCVATATFVHCAFRRIDPTASSMCQTLLTRVGNKTLTGVMTFMVLSAGQIEP